MKILNIVIAVSFLMPFASYAESEAKPLPSMADILKNPPQSNTPPAANAPYNPTPPANVLPLVQTDANVIFIGELKSVDSYIPTSPECHQNTEKCHQLTEDYKRAKQYRKYLFEVAQPINSEAPLLKEVSVINSDTNAEAPSIGNSYLVLAKTYSKRWVREAYVNNSEKQIINLK